jgi:cytochrome c-type biogenesis protein CcmH
MMRFREAFICALRLPLIKMVALTLALSPQPGRGDFSRVTTRQQITARWKGLMIAAVIGLAPLPALAVNPDEVLKDPVLEERARGLSAQLRCMVCQNQSIDDSNAELARDLRLLVRERIVDGDSDAQVIDYVVSRYGEFVLLKPRLSGKTLALWAMPVGLLLIGGVTVVMMARRRREAPEERALSAEEQARLDKLLGG